MAGSEGGRAIGHCVAAVVGAIGGDGFEPRLVELLTAARLDQCNVFCLDQGGEARPLYAWSRRRPRANARRVGRYVAERFFLQDPVLLRLRQNRPVSERVELFRRDDIEDGWYRRYFFDDGDLDGKVSMVERGPASDYYFNFYSGNGTLWTSPQDIHDVLGLADIVSQSILKHLEVRDAAGRRSGLPKLDMVRQLLERGAPRLTAREVDVCARQVLGYNTEAIALDLRIGAASVATYRKRAYGKLGICSQNELFTLCLNVAGTAH